MATRLKKGKYGMTRPRVKCGILGTVIIGTGQFSNMEGEIIAQRSGYMQYLTVQVSSEYEGRVYILNLIYSQCKDIKWR